MGSHEPLKQIQTRIQSPPNPFKQQDANNDVHEIAFHPHMVRPHHGQDLVQHVPDLDVAEGEGAGFDAEDQVLHFECEYLRVDDGVGLSAPLDH